MDFEGARRGSITAGVKPNVTLQPTCGASLQRVSRVVSSPHAAKVVGLCGRLPFECFASCTPEASRLGVCWVASRHRSSWGRLASLRAAHHLSEILPLAGLGVVSGALGGVAGRVGRDASTSRHLTIGAAGRLR